MRRQTVEDARQVYEELMAEIKKVKGGETMAKAKKKVKVKKKPARKR